VSLPIQKSTAENCVPADSEIGTQNFSTADSKIASQTAALPIQKLAADCAAADSKFSSQKLCRCRFRNQQRETVSLLIHKSAAMVESFQLYFSFFVFFLVFTITLHILPFYFHTTLHSCMLNPFIIMNMNFYLNSCMFP
jgi:hypothetical protein